MRISSTAYTCGQLGPGCGWERRRVRQALRQTPITRVRSGQTVPWTKLIRPTLPDGMWRRLPTWSRVCGRPRRLGRFPCLTSPGRSIF